MKILSIAAILLLLPLAPVQAQGTIYRWTDVKGVTHFTDNAENIPSRYRSKAKKVEVDEESTIAVHPPPVPSAQERALVDKEANGGHPEQWWRRRFTATRNELKMLEEGLPEKEAKLAELRRKHVIFQRPQDRVAANAENDAITADRQRIDQLRQQLSDLEAAAEKAGVPAEWRK